jgi:hypothetical protein
MWRSMKKELQMIFNFKWCSDETVLVTHVT